MKCFLLFMTTYNVIGKGLQFDLMLLRLDFEMIVCFCFYKMLMWKIRTIDIYQNYT